MIPEHEYKMLKELEAKGIDIGEDGRDAVAVYEAAKQSNPYTSSDVQTAKTMIAEGNTDPNLQNIIDVNKRFEAIGDKTKPYVFEPPQISTEGFQGNWPALYEYTTGKRLDMTPEGAKELNRFIQNFKYNYENGGNLQKLAYDMHMYNPAKESWSDFLKTNRHAAFNDFIQDVLVAKNREDAEKIFNDGTLSGWLTKTLMPVSYEYAKRNYNDIDGYGDMIAPIAFDVGSNIAMMGPGRLAGKPIINGIINNTAAPVITEAGHVIMNDKEAGQALTDAAMGIGTNLATPIALKAGENRVAQLGRGGFGSGAMKEQARINAAADKAAGIEKRLHAGEPYFELHPDELTQILEWDPPVVDFYGSDNPLRVLSKTEQKRKGKVTKNAQKNGELVQPEAFFKNRTAITPEEMKFYNENQQFIRGRKPNLTVKIGKEIHTASKEHPFAKVSLNILDEARDVMKKSLKEHGDLRLLSPEQLATLNLASQETLVNMVGRNIVNVLSDNPSLQNYLVNFQGKPQYGQRAYRALMPFMPDYGGDAEQKELSPLLQAILVNQEYKKQNPDK